MISTPATQRAQAIFWLVFVTLCWGLSFPLMKALMLLHERLAPGAGGWFYTAMVLAPRFLLGAVALGIWAWCRGWRITKSELKQGVTIGLFASAGMLLQSDGLQHTSASTSAFLTQFTAITIPVWVAVTRRRWPVWPVWVACGLVMWGVGILGGFRWTGFSLGRGEWETLGAALFFTGQILCLERKEFAANDGVRMTLVMFATQALVLGGVTFALAPSVGAVVAPWGDGVWLGLTAALTVVCTLTAFLLMNRWQPKVTATEAGLIYCAEPVFGSLMALVLPGLFSVWGEIGYANESVTRSLLAGGGLIVAANVLVQLRPLRKDLL